MASQARCHVPLRKHSPYIGPTGSGDIQSLAIALQQFISRKYGTSVDLHMAASVSRARRSATLNDQLENWRICMPENKIEEVDILNFALNLEYLEAEFYTYATTGKSITSFGIATTGRSNGSNPANGGTTKGGAKVSFSKEESILHDMATQIAADERAHVVLLRGALGSSAVAMPNIDLSALGFGFGNQNDFLRAARILEDIGVTAYSGAAHMLKTPVIMMAAHGLLGAEAEHAATIRTHIARLKIATTAIDGVDLIPPPSGEATQLLSIKLSDGLVATRTVGEVLYHAFGGKARVRQGGFFPTGLNGAIDLSSEAAASEKIAA